MVWNVRFAIRDFRFSKGKSMGHCLRFKLARIEMFARSLIKSKTDKETLDMNLSIKELERRWKSLDEITGNKKHD